MTNESREAQELYQSITRKLQKFSEEGNFEGSDTSYIFVGGGKKAGFTGGVDGDEGSIAETFYNLLRNSPDLVRPMGIALMEHIENNGCGDPDCTNCNPKGNSTDFDEFINNIINNKHD
jgi:hypothetical protein